MKLKDIFSKTKFIALASFAVLSLQIPLVHADGGAQIGGAQSQGSGALNSGSGQGSTAQSGSQSGPRDSSTCCTPTACITPCP
ncbi:hypothetical protein PLA107_029175 [Pseudomonas amygdali pv. lachrymans str. M301315]|uniref:Secreted protein n=2 Tax=Pseudomonas syringae group TaxID=136849 RepID=A0A8T8CBF8_PSEYM|nr:hypothetical protein B5U27_00070 [Pseudomonas amygdali pv. lachrymans]AXH58848.1 hypothetical protein PLA107_029175 [Pseudomonas amygdali pv. lachrymans str. M301315]PWC98713.1 hypothetical protein CX658_32360 [Pseudomonas amygdali pv. lachrymans]QHF00842.1 hypothetical protein PMA4326_030495 [Pseudomonas syringae pv. maculicola str. ES4326]